MSEYYIGGEDAIFDTWEKAFEYLMGTIRWSSKEVLNDLAHVLIYHL